MRYFMIWNRSSVQAFVKTKAWRKLILAMTLLLTASSALAQSTTVTLTVTDTPDNQTWNNGTYQTFFTGAQTPSWPGGSISLISAVTALSATGTASFSLPDNNTILPSGTQWRINACSATLPVRCFSQTITITGALQTVALTPPSPRFTVPTAPQVIASISAYADSEISGGWVGFTYSNVSGTATPRICTAISGATCTTWGAAGGISSVSSLPTTPCTNTTVNVLTGSAPPGGLYTCIGGNWVPDGGSITPQNTFDATAYGVQGNTGQACMDGSTTSSSPTVTTQGSCVFKCPGSVYPCSTAFTTATSTTTDVGKQIAVTTVCSSTGCGPYFYFGSINIMGATQTSLCTILSIQSATSLTSSCNAAQTCTFVSNASCAIIIAVDYTTQLNNTYAAALANTSVGCPRIQLPQGIIGYSAQLFKNPAGGNNNQCSIFGGTAGHIQQLAVVGASIYGSGQASTILFPLPNYNWAGCSGAANIGAGSNGLAFIDLSISGFGQSMAASGVTVGCNALVGSNSTYLHNVGFTGWGNRLSSTGVALNGYSAISDSYLSGFGGTGGVIAVNGSYVGLVNNNIAGTFQALLVNAGLSVVSTGNTYWGATSANSPGIEVVNGAIFTSNGDSFQGLNNNPTAATAAFQVDAGGTAYINNFINVPGAANNQGLKNAGTAFVFGWKDFATPGAGSVNNSGTFTDEGSNKFNGTFTNTGTVFGSYSITGTTITAPKLVLSAGWGTTAAWASLTGGTQYATGTLTASGTGQAANPTITYTFPTPFYATPSGCFALQVGGTQTAVANPFTPSSLTATGVTFTYNGTPGAGNTLQVQIECWNP